MTLGDTTTTEQRRLRDDESRESRASVRSVADSNTDAASLSVASAFASSHAEGASAASVAIAIASEIAGPHLRFAGRAEGTADTVSMVTSRRRSAEKVMTTAMLTSTAVRMSLGDTTTAEQRRRTRQSQRDCCSYCEIPNRKVPK